MFRTWCRLPGLAILACALPYFHGGAALAEDWPCFRGPTGQGVSTEAGIPTEWSATSSVAWKTEIPGEGWSSPIVSGESVFVTTATEGGASCRVIRIERGSGKVVWNKEALRQDRIGGNHSASPIYAGGKIYSLSESGESTIIAAGPQFQVIARNSINERCQASYAVSGKQLYIRSEHNLFCIGAPEKW